MASSRTKSGDTPPIEISGTLFLRSGEHDWGSEKRMALLAAIDRYGSITAAAKAVGFSYKAAWDAVETMSNLAGEPLVLRTTGGARGGGARLTDRARQLLELYQAVHEEHARFVARLSSLNAADQNLTFLQHMMIKTSVRNQIAGMISQIVAGAVNDEVKLDLGDGTELVASISRDTTRNLDLEVGKRVLAFIQETSIMLGVPQKGARLSARNQLWGRVDRITRGAVNAEVLLKLGDGHSLVVSLTMDSLERLGIEPGQEACALFKASSVMLGVLE